MHFIGIDPDLSTTAIAAVDEASRPVWCYVVKRPDKDAKKIAAAQGMVEALRGFFITSLPAIPKTGCGGFAVEAQEIVSSSRRGANPTSLLHLAYVSGAAHVLCREAYLNAFGGLVLPNTWKGSVPKLIHHKRICSRLDAGFVERAGYCVPVFPKEKTPAGAEVLKTSDWKHVLDAFGLALYARGAATQNKQSRS